MAIKETDRPHLRRRENGGNVLRIILGGAEGAGADSPLLSTKIVDRFGDRRLLLARVSCQVAPSAVEAGRNDYEGSP